MATHGKGGRRPLSTYLKDATKPPPEPGSALVLPSGEPEPPEFLNGPGLKEWVRICSLLRSIGLLTMVSRDRIARYVQAWQTYCQIQREWNKMTPQQKLYPSVRYDPYLWLKMSTEAVKEINAFESEYGLTPLASGRIQFPKGKNDAMAKLDSFLDED